MALCTAAGQVPWVEAAEPVELHLRGREASVRLPEGRHELAELQLDADVAALAEVALARAAELAAARAAAPPAQEEQPFGWQAERVALGTRIAELAVADLDGDGRGEWLVAGEEGVSAFSSAGELLWRFATEQPCRSVDAGDVNGDGAAEVAVGCDDTRVYLLSAQGEQLWSFACSPSTSTIALPAWVDLVRIADLDGDGAPEIVAGANWVHCLDAAGTLQWERYLRVARGMICGDFLEGAITDLDGDGTLEVLALFLYSYNQALAFNAAGEIVLPPDYDNDRTFGVNIDLPQCVLPTRALGTDAIHFIVGGASGMRVHWASGEHAGFPGFKTTGSCVALASWAPAEGPPIIFSADNMGTVTARRAQPPRGDEWIMFDVLWTQVIGRKVSRLGTADLDGDGRPELLVGLRDGGVRVLDALSGEAVAASAQTGSPVVGFGEDGERLLVLHADGLVQVPPAGAE